jgi:hypothetical protein
MENNTSFTNSSFEAGVYTHGPLKRNGTQNTPLHFREKKAAQNIDPTKPGGSWSQEAAVAMKSIG